MARKAKKQEQGEAGVLGDPSPGPWRAEIYNTIPGHPPEAQIMSGHDEIALVYATDGADEPTVYPAAANARLCAAAPDLLAAGRSVLPILEQLLEAGQPVQIELAELRSAIAKAVKE